jgi:gluconate 2-dehydrogenase subunit 3-like protein
MKKWSRRKFLEAGVVGSIAVGGAGVVRIPAAQPPPPGRGGAAQPVSPVATPEAQQRELLRSAMDEIIPASDGMPAASEVGGVDYLEKLAGRDAKVSKELRDSLAALDELSQKRFQSAFVALSHEQRVQALTALERQEAEIFKTLRDYVYEAYYEQPQVWKLIDYTCYPTNGGGPTLKPFNEEILAEVRKKPKFYREV